MSLITIIESENTSSDLKNTFSNLTDVQSVSAVFHGNAWLFGLVRREPYIDLWIHDYLACDASWEDANLKLNARGNELLLKFMSDFIQKHHRPFLFWSMWSGDEFGAPTIEVSSAQFLEFVSKSQLSTRSKYRVIV